MPRWKRVLRITVRILVAVILGAPLLYLAAANAFLAFLLRPITRSPNLSIEYARAWSVWPGRAHVRGFRVQSRSDTVEWSLDVEAGVVDVNLLDLFQRRVHMSGARAEDLKFRLRQGVSPRDADDPKNAWLPPIPPYADPPISRAGAPAPELKLGKYKYWVIEVDDSDARVTEVWINAYRFEGSSRSRGGFKVAPHRSIALTHSLLEVTQGTLTLAKEDMAREIHGTVTCEIESFDPDTQRDRALLRAFDIEAKMIADVPSIAFLEYYVPAARVRFSEGGGRVRGEVGLHRGNIDDGSVIDLTSERTRVAIPKAEFELRNGRFQWKAEGGHTVLSARIPESRIWRTADERGDEHPDEHEDPADDRGKEVTKESKEFGPAIVSDVTAAYTTETSDVVQGLGFGGLSAKVPGAVVDDIRWLTGKREGSSARFEGGRVRLAGDLDVDAEHHVKSQAKVTVDGGTLVVKKARLHGDFAATARVTSDDIVKTRTVDLQGGKITLTRAGVTSGKDRHAIEAQADVDGGTLDLRDGFAMDLSSHAVVKGMDAVLELVGAPWEAEVGAALIAAESAKGKARLRYHDGLLSVQLLEAACGLARVKGELQQQGKVTAAAFVMKVDPFSMGIAVANGHVTTAPLPPDGWLDEHRPRLKPHGNRADRNERGAEEQRVKP
jgi:hypothetical protein